MRSTGTRICTICRPGVASRSGWTRRRRPPRSSRRTRPPKRRSSTCAQSYRARRTGLHDYRKMNSTSRSACGASSVPSRAVAQRLRSASSTRSWRAARRTPANFVSLRGPRWRRRSRSSSTSILWSETATSSSAWKSTSVSGAPDDPSLSHFSAMARPSWLRRAVRNRHRHAIKQASHRWRRRFSATAP